MLKKLALGAGALIVSMGLAAGSAFALPGDPGISQPNFRLNSQTLEPGCFLVDRRISDVDLDTHIDFTYLGDDGQFAFDVVRFSPIDRDRSPPGRGIAGHNLRGHQLEESAFPIGKRATQTIHFVLHIAQRLVRRLERSVLHLERGVVSLHFLERLQPAPNRGDRFLEPGASLEERRDQRIEPGLEFSGAVRAETQKISQDSREDSQRDNARAVHADTGDRIAETGKVRERVST